MILMNKHKLQHPAHKQAGVALIVSMVILLVLTVLAVASMRMGTLQERMTHNLRESSIALNGAESALLDGETWLAAQVKGPNMRPPEAQSSCSGGCGTPVDVWREDVPEHAPEWIAQNGRTITLSNDTDLTLVSTSPSYVVEKLEPGAAQLGNDLAEPNQIHSGQQYYRVTADSPGRNQQTQSVLQTIYATRF